MERGLPLSASLVPASQMNRTSDSWLSIEVT